MVFCTSYKHKLPDINYIELDMDDYYKYDYTDFIPSGFSKGYIHDIALVATILCAEGKKQGIPYITDWELDKVGMWVESINPNICVDVGKSCKAISRMYN